MAKLTYQRRKHMAKSEFAEPGRRAYPIDTANRARNALARVAQHGSESEQKTVRAAVHRKFPDIGSGGRSKTAKKSTGRRSRSRSRA